MFLKMNRGRVTLIQWPMEYRAYAGIGYGNRVTASEFQFFRFTFDTRCRKVIQGLEELDRKQLSLCEHWCAQLEPLSQFSNSVLRFPVLDPVSR